MQVTPADIEQAAKALLAELMDVEESEIGRDDRLREDLGMDSLQSMELLSRLSEEYEIDPDMDDVMQVHTLGDVVTFLGGYLDAA
ncbi:MAG: acyl carrier protein [Myxococcota bacterium]